MSVSYENKDDQLKIQVFRNREEMGEAAAALAAAKIAELLQHQETVNIIFAAAASQNEFLAALLKKPVDWYRINAFHMDEYIGLPEGAPQHFSVFLRERIFDKVPFRNVFLINGSAPDPEQECARYAALLEAYPADITFMGIGENTHLAFNDPHMADFNDPKLVKIVDLDIPCRQQQVNEGCFPQLSQVPVDAYTLTIPALLRAKAIYCMVPGKSKAPAAYHTLTADITEKYPSTILRTLPNAWLLLDADSAAEINDIPMANVFNP